MSPAGTLARLPSAQEQDTQAVEQAAAMRRAMKVSGGRNLAFGLRMTATTHVQRPVAFGSLPGRRRADPLHASSTTPHTPKLAEEAHPLIVKSNPAAQLPETEQAEPTIL